MDKALKRTFAEMHATLDRHLSAFENLETVELDTQTMLFENRRAFENLRNTVSALPMSVRKQFKIEAQEIVDKNHQLTRVLAKRKQTLSAMLIDNAKGKKALKGYQGGTGTHQTYRFMNTAG